ncbi:MAG: NFACT RNA binding domain-containing protein [Myxococcales bacterium]
MTQRYAGGVVQRIRLLGTPENMGVLLWVRVPGETAYVFIANAGVGLLAREQTHDLRAQDASLRNRETSWRQRFEGAHVTRLATRSVCLETQEASFALVARSRSVELVNALPTEPWAEHADLLTRGSDLAQRFVCSTLETERDTARRSLRRAIERVDRRIAAVSGDLARIGDVSRKSEQAKLFVAEASRAPRGLSKLCATDWSTGEPHVIELPLDPSRSAREQLDAVFRRAKRLKEGARFAQIRLDAAQQLRSNLDTLAMATEGASLETLQELEKTARALAPQDFRRVEAPSVARKTPTVKGPGRLFRAGDGGVVWVGRGAEHNDELTFHVAKPHYLWLHAKGFGGAHVLVPLDKGASCPAERLVDAAHLAAHFSDARSAALVEVQYTPRRYLRKPRGTAPGLVVVDREKVMILRFDPARLAALLAREEA